MKLKRLWAKVTDIPYQIRRGIRNLIDWFPTIWGDEQFDQFWFYRILHKKLTLMEKFYRSEYTMSADAEKVAKEIQICRVLIERLLKDEYDEPEQTRLYEKWGQQCKGHPIIKKLVNLH